MDLVQYEGAPGRVLVAEISRRFDWLTSKTLVGFECSILVLVNALDLVTTYVLLNLPGAPVYEANPIARELFQLSLPGVVLFKFGLVAVAVVCCELVARQNRQLAQRVLAALIVLVGTVVAYASTLIAQHLPAA